MANKRDDFDLDDFSLDDFDDDGLGGFDGPGPGKKRSPVEILAGGFKEGIKSSLTDRTNQARIIRGALPQGYNDAIDLIDKSIGEASSLYDTAAKEAKPIIAELRKGSKLIQPMADKILPKKLSNALKRFGEKQESEGWGSLDPEKMEMDSALGSIFSAYQEANQRQAQDRDNQQQVRDYLNIKQNQTSLQALLAISSGINRLVSYQDQVAAQVQRKTIELQYKQYFVLRKTLDVAQQQKELSESAYKVLIKNTALPEVVKIHNSEMFHQMMKEKLFSGIMGDWTSGIGRRLMNKAQGSLKEFTSSFGMNLSNAVANASMMREGIEAAGVDPKEMGLEMAGMGIGGEVGNWLGQKMTGPMKRYFENNEQAAGKAMKAGRFVKNLPEHMARFSRDRNMGSKMASGLYDKFGPKRRTDPDDWTDWSLEDRPILNFLDDIGQRFNDFLRDGMGSPDKPKHIKRNATDNLEEAMYFSRRSDKTLNEIIPGWLGKIHQELYIMRSGDKDAQPLRYSFHTGQFESVNEITKGVLKRVFNKDEVKASQDNLKGVLDSIDPESKLSKPARAALAKYLVRRANNNEDMNLPVLAKGGEEFPQELVKWEKKITQHIQDRFGFNEKGEESDWREYQGRLGSSEDAHRKLRDYLPAFHQKLSEESDLGNLDVLEKLGLVRRNGDSDFELDEDKLLETIRGVNPRRRAAGGRVGGSRIRRYSEGSNGPIRGPGTETSDDIPAMLSDGETVVNARGSKFPGVAALLKFLNKLGNKMRGTQGQGPMDADAQAEDAAIQNDTLQEILNQQRQTNEALNKLVELMQTIPQTPLMTHELSPEMAAGLSYGERGAVKLFRGARNSAGKAFGIARNSLSTIARKARSITGLGFKTTKSVLQKAGQLVGFGVQMLEDVYVVGEEEPRLIAAQIRSGKYIDKNSKKVIAVPKDITGPVIDADGNYFITQEDFEKGVYGKRSRKLLHKAFGLVKKAFNFATSPLRAFKSAVSKTYNFVKTYGEISSDIYVAGEDKPRLLARVFRTGGYRLKKTGKVISRIKDLTGDIIDEKGNVVLSLEDIHKGLVDSKGKPVKGLLGKIGNILKPLTSIPGLALKGAMKAKDIMANIIGKGLGLTKSALGILMKGLGGGLGGLFGNSKPVVDKLDKIYALLDERLPGGKSKKASSDTDGDGLREGSWQDRLKKRAAGMKDSAMSKLESMFGGLMGKMKGGDGKEKKGIFSMITGLFGKLPALFSGMAGLVSAGMGAVKSLTSLLGGGLLKTAVKMGGGLARGALGAGKMLMKGGGGLLRGALTAASWGARLLPMAGSALTALAGVITAPVALGALAVGAMAYGGYKLYKYYTQPNTPIAKFRMAQYGYSVDDEKHVSKIIELEQKCSQVVRVTSGKPATLGTGLSVSDLIKLFEVDETNQSQVEKWIAWFTQRFKPVYLAHVTLAYAMAGKTDISKIDDLLTSDKKLDYIKRVDFGNDRNSPYVFMMSPFGSDEKVDLDADEVKDIMKDCISWIDDHRKETDTALAMKSMTPEQRKRKLQESKGVWDSTKEAAGKAWDKFKGAVSGATNSVVQNAKAIGGGIKAGYDTAVNATSKAIESGANVANAVYQGAKTAFNSLKGSAKEKFQAVMDAARRAGDPHPEVVAAQWALESGWGKHESGKFNFFGIKAHGDEPGTIRRTREVFGGRETYINDKFRDYNSLDEGIAGRVSFIAKNKRYTKAGYFDAKTPFQAAATLQKAGYATDPQYANLLAKVMSSAGIDPNAPSGTGSAKAPGGTTAGPQVKGPVTMPGSKDSGTPKAAPAAAAPVKTSQPQTTPVVQNAQPTAVVASQKETAKQAEGQRQVSNAKTANTNEYMAKLAEQQLEVTKNMDKTLLRIDETLVRIETMGKDANQGKQQPPQQRPRFRSDGSNPNDRPVPPVPMTRV